MVSKHGQRLAVGGNIRRLPYLCPPQKALAECLVATGAGPDKTKGLYPDRNRLRIYVSEGFSISIRGEPLVVQIAARLI